MRALRLVIMLIFCFAQFAYAEDAVPLKPEKAFTLTLEITSSAKAVAKWEIAQDYFLYATRLKISSPNATIKLLLPPAKIMHGIGDKPEALYSDQLSVPIEFSGHSAMTNLQINYQGCAKSGFCYPPTEKNYVINWNTKTISAYDEAAVSSTWQWRTLLTDHVKIQDILSTNNMMVTLLIFFMLGILLAFTPCVLPMVPILTSIILGHKHRVGTWRAFGLSFTYVMGMAITYAIAGVFAALLGSSLQVILQKPVFIIAVSIIFIMLALSMFEFYDLPFSKRLQNKIMSWSDHHESGTFIGVFLMGVLSTLIVSPCVTAPLIGVLIYIGQTGNIYFGASALFIMALGMGVPLMLVGVSAEKWLPKSGPWMRLVVKSFGMLMFGIALWLLARILPAAITHFLWGVFSAALLLFVLVYLPKQMTGNARSRVIAILILLLCLLGIAKIAGVIPEFLAKEKVLTSQLHNEFITIRSIDELNRELNKAKILKKPVLVDFYAEWCEACVVMEKNVIKTNEVAPALSPFILIRADLSQNTSENQALMKMFHVIAPPTFIFFDRDGQEVLTKRLVGEMDAEQFLQKINLFFAAGCDTNARC